MIAEDLKVLYDIAGNSLNANSVRFACAASNEQLRALIERTSQAEARVKELEAQVEQMRLFMVRAASIHDGNPHNLWVRNLGRQARQLLANSASAEKEQQ